MSLSEGLKTTLEIVNDILEKRNLCVWSVRVTDPVERNRLFLVETGTKGESELIQHLSGELGEDWSHRFNYKRANEGQLALLDEAKLLLLVRELTPDFGARELTPTF